MKQKWLAVFDLSAFEFLGNPITKWHQSCIDCVFFLCLCIDWCYVVRPEISVLYSSIIGLALIPEFLTQIVSMEKFSVIYQDTVVVLFLHKLEVEP
jgi:hypothetical protein